ncbi:MAG: SDR family oxidoreductase [Verrucomicrobiota bacterium]
MQTLIGKRVLITGAAVRVGQAVATAFAQEGATVIIHYRRSQRHARDLRDQLIDTTGRKHFMVQADLVDSRDRAHLIHQAADKGGGLDCLINNASVYRRSYLKDVEEDDLRRDYEINFVAPFMLMRDFRLSVGSGSIINILDQRVTGVDPASGTYGCAKKSLRDVTEAAAVEWAPAIRVNGVAPGVVLPPPGVDEEKMEPLIERIPMKRKTDSDEIAAACIFLAAAETVTGTVLYVDGGLHLKSDILGEKAPES